MTKFFLRFSGLAFVLALLIATGCSEDDPIIDTPLGPEIALSAEAGFVSSDIELLVGEPFSVKVIGTPGDNPLETLALEVDNVQPKGTELSNYVTGFFVDGAAETAQNPQLLVGAVKNGATWQYDLVPFGMMEGDISNFSFTVADESGLIASISFDVTIVPPPGTPVDTMLAGILLNQAGPAGTGGLDLDGGIGTGSADAEAEIRDLGIDCTINQNNEENWRAQFGSVNGTDMVKVDTDALPEGFSFENVKNKEEIVDAYDSGIALADGVSTSPSCNETPVTDVTDTVVEGDLFVVKKGDLYYLLSVDEVNYVHGFAANPGINNDDNYVISIKY